MVGHKRVRCLLISGFNVQKLAGYLSNDADSPVVEAEVAPYGQLAATLTDREAACWRRSPDVAVVWTRPQSVIPGFEILGHHEASATADSFAGVGAFAALLKKASERVGTLLVPTWSRDADRDLGMLDWRSGVGRAHGLARMNIRLAEECADQSNIFVLDAERWMRIGGRDAFDAKLWYLAKIPFGNEVFKAAVADIKACLRAFRGETRKLLVVDLDDSLWGGVVGELGWERLRLGGHDGVGEAYRDFQSALKWLTSRGVLLAIASKNEEAVALQAIRSHPEMVLKLDDFAAWRINSGDKAENVVDIAAELNLGLQSVVFIDDNPVERERISSALPDVLVPAWPKDPFLYPSALRALDCFDTTTITAEIGSDANPMFASGNGRTQENIAERGRLAGAIGHSFDDREAQPGKPRPSYPVIQQDEPDEPQDSASYRIGVDGVGADGPARALDRPGHRRFRGFGTGGHRERGDSGALGRADRLHLEL